MKHIIKIIIILLLTVSCDTTKDYHERYNDRPQLTVKAVYDDNFSKKATDTMKLKLGDYILYYQITDEEKLPVKVECALNYTAVTEDDKIIISAKETGVGKVRIIAKDSFGAWDEIAVELTCINNLLPVAHLEVEDMPFEHEKRLDASQSYDADSKYGGKIELYRFLLNGIEIEKTYHSFIHFTFPGAGYYELGLQVLDNDEEWSSMTYKTITIN